MSRCLYVMLRGQSAPAPGWRRLTGLMAHGSWLQSSPRGRGRVHSNAPTETAAALEQLPRLQRGKSGHAPDVELRIASDMLASRRG